MKTDLEIIDAAYKNAASCNQNEEYLFALLGAVPNDAHVFSEVTFVDGKLSFDAVQLSIRGKEIFEKFRKYLEDAVCKDFNYCEKRKDVDANLKKYLPDIVKALTKKIPIIDKLPDWILKILGLFGIAPISIDVIIAVLVAWLIIKGCDELCKCAV